MTQKLRNMTSLYLVREDAVLCLYRIGSKVADRKYIGSAGGHFESEELNDPEKCVLREAKEELGISLNQLEDFALRYITLRLTGGEIRQNYYYFARLKEDIPLSSTEGQLHWIPFDHVMELEMPVSAKHMILHYLQQGRHDRVLYCGVTEKNGTRFVPMEDFVT